MNLTRTAAVKGLIPAGKKVTELRQNLTRLMAEMANVLDQQFGREGLSAVAKIFETLGSQDAQLLKKRLGLGNQLRDAVDAWIVIGRLMGSKMVIRWVSNEHVETDHPFCPQYEAFKARGRLYCEAVCLPYVKAVAEGIASDVQMRVIRPASESAACTKALVLRHEE